MYDTWAPREGEEAECVSAFNALAATGTSTKARCCSKNKYFYETADARNQDSWRCSWRCIYAIYIYSPFALSMLMVLKQKTASLAFSQTDLGPRVWRAEAQQQSGNMLTLGWISHSGALWALLCHPSFAMQDLHCGSGHTNYLRKRVEKWKIEVSRSLRESPQLGEERICSAESMLRQGSQASLKQPCLRLKLFTRRRRNW